MSRLKWEMGFGLGWVAGKAIWYGLNKANTVGSSITEARMEKHLSAYGSLVGLGDDFKFTNQPFNEFMEARKKSLDELETTFATAIKDEKLKATLNDPVINAQVLDVFKQAQVAKDPNKPDEKEDSLALAMKNYTANTEVFGKLSQQIPPLKVEAVIQTMKDIIDEGVSSIKKQQELEIANLKKLFAPTIKLDGTSEPSEFVKSLTSKDIKAEEVEKAQKAMLADLSKTHEAQLKGFTDATSESLKQVHQAAENDFADLNFVASLMADSKKMREHVQTTAANKQEADRVPVEESLQKKEKELAEISKLASKTEAQIKREAELEGEIEETKAIIKQIDERFGALGIATKIDSDKDPHIGHVKLADLEVIYSKTGATINQKEKGKFNLEIAAMLNPFGSPVGYFLGNKIQHDIDLLAEAVKASGYTSIQMDVDFSNEEVARKRAEQAYRACINAGFPPDKITIKMKVNGQEIGLSKNDKGEEVKSDKYWTPEKAFSAEERQHFATKAQERAAAREKAFKLDPKGHEARTDNGVSVDPVKEAKVVLEELKAKHASEEAEKAKQAKEKEADANNAPDVDPSRAPSTSI